jgi:hypothetical protein
VIRTTGNGTNNDGEATGTASTGAKIETGTGASDSTGVLDGPGDGDGDGDGDGVAVGSGVTVGSGVPTPAGRTCAVGSERFFTEPTELVTVTRARRNQPTSYAVSSWLEEVAPATAVQAPPSFAQRSHSHVVVGSGSPLHVAVAERANPSWAVPVTSGTVVAGLPAAFAA